MPPRTTEPSPPQGGLLDRDRIVAAALASADERGLPALSMRRLGETLGLSPRRLSHHVHDRDDLLSAIAQRLVREALRDLAGPADGHPTWPEVLGAVARGFRRVVQEHPRVFPLLATRPPDAPWAEPPLRSRRSAEIVLGSLLGAGFSEQSAVSAYRHFGRFLLGQLLLEATPELGDEAGDPPRLGEPTGVAEHPTLGRVAGLLDDRRATPDFEAALRMELRHIDRQAAADHDLSPREEQIVTLLAEGLSNQEIADRAFIGENTVKTHLRSIFQKLGVETRTQAALWATGGSLEPTTAGTTGPGG